ncbi:MAG: hypothetical protein ACTHK3_02075 [Solirubrobacterales bacterium]
MRYLKVLGLAAIVAMAFSAYLGAGSASAEVFCKTNVTPTCPVGWDMQAGDGGESSLRGSETMETTSNMVLQTCTSGIWQWEVLNTGGPPGVLPVWADVKKVRSNCTSSISMLKLGSAKVENIEGTENGTVVEKESEVTFVSAGVSCIYGTGSGTDIGVLEAGSEETALQVNAVLNKTGGSFLCANTIKWTGRWVLTNLRIRVQR